jgi:hypothetical protein
MAARVASGQLALALPDKPIQITEILEDLDEALARALSSGYGRGYGRGRAGGLPLTHGLPSGSGADADAGAVRAPGLLPERRVRQLGGRAPGHGSLLPVRHGGV